MKKIIDLQTKRAEIVSKMEVISNVEDLSVEQRTEWTGLDNEIKDIDAQIAILERQEELNKANIAKEETVAIVADPVKPIGVQFRDWLFDSVEKGGKAPTFRADPIITSTDTGIIEKVVKANVDILVSPAEAWLKSLGVTFYTGLTNTLYLPNMAEDLATFPGENSGAASANMATTGITLAPRRVSHTQSISKETLAQTNPTIYSSILANLVTGVWNCVANDVFDTLQSDAPGQQQPGGITYLSIAGMEASLAYTNIGSLQFVTTPTNKATLKTTAKMANQQPIWGPDNTVLGYPASAAPAANATMLYLGDFSKMAIAQWGGLEVIVDPYSDAKKGLVNLTIVGLFDSGCTQPRGLVWHANA